MKELHGIDAVRALAKDITDHGDPVEGARLEAKAKGMAIECQAAEEMLAARVAKRKAAGEPDAAVPAAPVATHATHATHHHDDEPAKRKSAR